MDLQGVAEMLAVAKGEGELAYLFRDGRPVAVTIDISVFRQLLRATKVVLDRDTLPPPFTEEDRP